MTSRPVAALLLSLLALATAVAVAVANATANVLDRDGHRRTMHDGFQIRFDGHGPEWWAVRWRREHRAAAEFRRQLHHTHRLLLQRPSVVEAINLSCATYGNCSTLWRRARCETGGTYSPLARNPSGASGLYQFMPSTFRSTPYGGFSIWSPYANALAAGWMETHGRGSEWSCR